MTTFNSEWQPDPEAIRAAMDKLERMLPAVPAPKVAMLNGVVSQNPPEHPCGTVACVGGFYLLADLLAAGASLEWDKGGGEGVYLHRQGNMVRYTVGANRLAYDLGLANHNDLEWWARRNSKIWGNADGEAMFFAAGAYGLTPDNISLEGIIAHWRGVADRLEARK